MKTTILYRPIGVGEYLLIKNSNYTEFPPRLEWQPIFYPVLNQAYAEQIALDWNTEDEFSGYCGLVTSFQMPTDYLASYEVKNVGGHIHNELWILSEELKMFNQQIIGEIKIVNAFFGDQFNLGKNKELNNYYLKFK